MTPGAPGTPTGGTATAGAWLYRAALRLLPDSLRRKHGPAMEALLARELASARARGRLPAALAVAAAVWDVARRGAYEHARTGHALLAGRRDRRPRASWRTNAPGPEPAGANPGGPSMPNPETPRLLRRHATAFAVALLSLTAALLVLYATRVVPALGARGAPAGTALEALLLAVPFTAAMTIPMAVLVAVLWVFTRLGAEGALLAARRERGGVRRLVAPVLAAAVVVAALTLAWNDQVVPRANARLTAVLAGDAAASGASASGARSDRAMTTGELRTAARRVRAAAGPGAQARAAAYEVEAQKKYALAAACVVLALAGAAIALRVPRGGAPLVVGASLAVFVAYYACLVAGETLADRLVVSPAVAMWSANALLLAAASLAVRGPVAALGSRLAH